MKDAITDCDKLMKKKERIEKKLSKIQSSREFIFNQIDKDNLTLEAAEKKLKEYQENESGFRNELDNIDAQLVDLPDMGQAKIYAEPVGDNPGDVVLYDDFGNQYAGGNDVQSFLIMMEDKNGQDRRDLIK